MATETSVRVANGANIESSTRATIPLAAELSSAGQVDHIFDDLKSGSLISIGQLCNDDCIALFTKYHVDIIKHHKVIIQGKRNPTNGLWNIPLSPPSQAASSPRSPSQPTTGRTHHANGAIRNAKTKKYLAVFLHGCAFSPLPSTLL